jgi:hypothetical protein
METPMRAVLIAALLALAPAARAATPADVARLAWIAGSWAETSTSGTVTRETWLPPLDGAMAGAGQTTRPGKPPLFEFASITAEPAGVTFTAHVAGQPPTPFVMKPGAEGEAVFENLAHDFPQRVIYQRCGDDLCAAIEGAKDGKTLRIQWRYQRMAP